MSTDKNSPSVLDAAPNNPPKKRNFLPQESLPTEPETATQQPNAAQASPKKLDSSGKSAKGKKEPAPKRVPWAFRVLPTIIEDWDAYMATLPRHISQQDVMEYLLTDFLKRKPKLPDELLKPPIR